MRGLSIPNYLESKTKDGLRQLMRLAQVKYKMRLVFYDFQYAQGMWTCWFEVPLAQELEKDMNDGTAR